MSRPALNKPALNKLGPGLLQRAAAIVLALACSACMSLSPIQRDRAAAVAFKARDLVEDCDRGDQCASASPLRELGGTAFAESTPTAPRHYALLLDGGSDALLARIRSIRVARHIGQ